MDLNKFFNPKSIAVIGASPEQGRVGNALLINLLSGEKREIYPVNPSYAEVLKMPCFKSVLDIKGEIDFALIAIRADKVAEVLEECGRKNIRNLAVISAGFREIGGKGKELEENISKISLKYRMNLIGPNCLGVINAGADFNASFSFGSPVRGGISFISQSGAIGAAMVDWAVKEGIGMAKFISLGNEAAMTELEFLEYLSTDEETKSVLVYLEKISDGKRFMELIKKTSEKKPVVILKAGRSKKGAEAAASHTGSLAPEDSVFTAASKQSGAIVVDSLRAMFNLAKLFNIGVTRPLRNLAVVTNAGGPGVLAADLIDLSKSLNLVEFKESTKEALKKVLPTMAAISNPVDVIGDASSQRYQDSLNVLVKEKDIDAILIILTAQTMTDSKDVVRVIAPFAKDKKIIPVFIGGMAVVDGIQALKTQGLVNFDLPEDAIEALDILAMGEEKEKRDQKGNKQKDQFKMMSFNDAANLLKKYDLKISGSLVKEKKDLKGALKELKSKSFVIKLISPDVIHKTEVGAVKVGSKDSDELAEAETLWDEILNSVKSKVKKVNIEGMLLQPMQSGKEVIIGMKRDPVFGPIILFGLGGIFVEVIKDTAIRVAPVSKSEAKTMIQELKSAALLKGSRGQKPVDLDKISLIISAVSKLSLEHPEVKEIDLNPVIVDEKDAVIVDARFMV